MIEIHKEFVGDIPYLHIVKDQNRMKRLPLVIFVHGFTSAKEHNLHFAYLLAEKGFRVVLPDAILHGEREQAQSEEERMFRFWPIVTNTIKELDQLKESLVEKELVDAEKIGLVGTSMGGIVTFGALTQYNWIKTAVSLMGSPCYELFAKLQIDQLKKVGIKLPFTEEVLSKEFEALRQLDLSQQPELLQGRPLLFWHGKQDPVVPFQPTYEFYQQIQYLYKENPHNLEFIIDERAGHKVSREALLRTVDWFSQHLLKSNE